MSWQTEMVTIVRYIIGDTGATPENTDSSLQSIICIAARFVDQDVDFPNTYAIDVVNVSITPDPTSVGDTAFINLVCLKAACLLARSEQKMRARMGMSIKDGPSVIDGRASAEGTAKWSDTICQDYTDAELEYRMGNRTPGAAIIGPYRYDGSGYVNSPTRSPTYNNEYLT